MNQRKNWKKPVNPEVLFPAHVYKKFLAFALQHASSRDSSTWKEVVGVLVGRMGDERVEINDVICLDAGSAFFVEVNDYSKIFSAVPFERLEAGESIVGWIHSHPGLGIFMSGTDTRTQTAYQRLDSRAIAIVLDFTKISRHHPGIAVFRVDLSDERSYHEIPWTIPEAIDFQDSYSAISQDLKDFEFYEEFKQRIELPNIALSLEGPSQTSIRSSFKVKVILQADFDFPLRFEYPKPETKNCELLTRLIGSPIINESDKRGIIAILRFMPKEEGKCSFIIKNAKATDKGLDRVISEQTMGFETKVVSTLP